MTAIFKEYTAQEIRAAVDAGKTVYADTGAYTVIKDSKGQHLIHCTLNNSYTGLTGAEGTVYENRLNASKFAIVESEPSTTPDEQNFRVTAVSEPTELKRAKINQSSSAALVLREFWPDDIEYRETAVALFINRAMNTTGIAVLSAGGTAGTVVDIKQLAKLAIDIGAHSVIIAHNHPSGNLKPSDADIKLTKKVKNALELLDIALLDHLILTADDHFSIADNGLM